MSLRVRPPSSRSLPVLLLALLGLLALPGCQSLGLASSKPAEANRLDHILESRTLRVGLTGDQPPLNMKSSSNQTIGLEVDLVNALAGSMGLSVKLVEMPFAELLPALERGDVDLVISGMTITPERNARVAFAGPYFISGKSVLTKRREISRAHEASELDISSRTYAALAGSTSEDFVKQVLPHARLVTTKNYDEAVDMVLKDQVDAMIADFPICEVSVLRHPDAGLSTLTTPFTIEPLGIALPADAPLLVNLVENYLNTLDATGMLPRLKVKWFSEGNWVAEIR